jgi:hypothetical protein
MSKKIKLIIGVLLVTALVLSTGCNSKNGTSTADEGAKYPTSEKIIEGKNSTGMCYDIDLESFTEQVNSFYKSNFNVEGPCIDDDGKENQPLDKDGWQVVGEKSQEDGDTTFTYYSQMAGKAQLLIAVDDSSSNIISFVAETTNLIWQNDANEVSKLAVIGSIVAGGYSASDYKFFKKLYNTSISGNCYYDNAIYKVIGDDSESEEDMVIKLMSIPCTTDAIKDTEYTDYKQYKENKLDFGIH